MLPEEGTKKVFVEKKIQSFIIGLHLRPQDVEMLDQLRQFVLTHGPHNGQVHVFFLMYFKHFLTVRGITI